MEDGEINGGFLGDHEMEERKALASAHGEGTNMSWVEAVLIGTGQVKAGDFPDATEARGHESAEDPDPAATIPVSCTYRTALCYSCPFLNSALHDLCCLACSLLAVNGYIFYQPTGRAAFF